MIRFFMMSKRKLTNLVKRKVLRKISKIKLAGFDGKKDKTRLGKWAGGQISSLKRWGQEHGIVVMRT